MYSSVFVLWLWHIDPRYRLRRSSIYLGSVLAFTAQFVRIYFHLFCSLSFWLTFFPYIFQNDTNNNVYVKSKKNRKINFHEWTGYDNLILKSFICSGFISSFSVIKLLIEVYWILIEAKLLNFFKSMLKNINFHISYLLFYHIILNIM